MGTNWTYEWFLKDSEEGKGFFPLAFGLRVQVFVEEQGFESEEDPLDETAWHLLLKDGEEPVATARIYQVSPEEWAIGRVAVNRAYRGTGLGAAALHQAEERIRLTGGKKASLSAQVRARGFYERQGYQAVGRYYYDEFCPHIHMEKALEGR